LDEFPPIPTTRLFNSISIMINAIEWPSPEGDAKVVSELLWDFLEETGIGIKEELKKRYHAVGLPVPKPNPLLHSRAEPNSPRAKQLDDQRGFEGDAMQETTVNENVTITKREDGKIVETETTELGDVLTKVINDEGEVVEFMINGVVSDIVEFVYFSGNLESMEGLLKVWRICPGKCTLSVS